MNINILEIAVAAVILLFAAAGYRKGFVKKLAAMVSLLVSVVLVSALLPWITAFLKENTPVYTMIEEQCRTVMEKQIGEALFSGAEKSTGESSQAEIYRNMGREEMKALIEANGYDGSLLDALSDEQLEQYKEQYIQQYFGSDTTDSGGSENSGAFLLGNLTRIEQTELIENLPLPEFLQDILLDYNNEEGYQGLGVSTFQDYLVGFIATGILNVAAFLVSVLIVHLLLWLSISALSILTNLPVIRVVNRVAGLALGLLQALLVLWLAFLILSLVSGTGIGMQLMKMVESSNWLNWLYQSNLFLEIVLRASAFFR
ncbi:MAG: CvpA family protein [Lachnospiraceae bacterium]|nr:CvpA family protein [Lachnospiraceae bacterium]